MVVLRTIGATLLGLLCSGYFARAQKTIDLSPDPNVPWVCTEMISPSGIQDVNTFDHFMIRRNVIIPYYTDKTSGIGVYDALARQYYKVTPNVPLNIGKVHLHAASYQKIERFVLLLAGYILENNPLNFSLGIMTYSFTQNMGKLYRFRIPISGIRDNYGFHLIKGIDLTQYKAVFIGNTNRQIILNNQSVYYRQGLIVTIDGTLKTFVPMTAKMHVLSISNHDFLITDVNKIDTNYILISGLYRTLNGERWSVLLAILDRNLNLVDTVSFIIPAGPVIEIKSSYIGWENSCTKFALLTGYMCNKETKFDCVDQNLNCEGIVIKALMEQVPDESVPAKYRWQFVNFEWAFSYRNEARADLDKRGTVDLFYDLDAVNTYNNRYALIVGETAYWCRVAPVLEDMRGGWAIKIDLDSGKVLGSWLYTTTQSKYGCSQYRLNTPWVRYGYKFTGVTINPYIVTGTAMLKMLEGYENKCTKSQDFLILTTNYGSIFPPREPKCCEAYTGAKRIKRNVTIVPTPSISFQKNIDLLQIGDFSLSTFNLQIGCSGYKSKDPKDNIINTTK